MKILVDADACPVVLYIEQVASEFNLPVILLCDTNHILSSDYCDIIVVDAGADAVDYALVNRCKKGDIVVTGDYGVAAMVLGKGAHAMHQSGFRYTNENIESKLFERHIAKEIRRSSSRHHMKGQRKRTSKDDERFYEKFKQLISYLLT